MSTSSQKAFLTKLMTEIDRTSNEASNKEQRALLNTNAHVFTITSRALKRAIRESVQKAGNTTNSVEAKKMAALVSRQVDGDILKFIANMTIKFRLQESKGLVSVTTATNRRLVVLVKQGGDVFNRIKGVYNNPLNILFASINKKAKGLFNSRGEVFSLEHGHFVGVLESSLRTTIENVLTSSDNADGNTLADVKSFLASQGVDVRVIRNSSTDTMQVFIGSTVVNQQERGSAQKKKNALRKTLIAALEKLESNPNFSFMELKGSDSFSTIKRKKTIKKTTDPFRGKKNVTVTTEDLKIKHSKTDVSATLKHKAKLKTLNRRKAIKDKKQASPASVPLAKLMATMNARLPQVVAKNMESPALNYRTGRFAASVKVTDVNKTPKGLPSIGYTYMKYPYQTFEPGFAQGDVNRDPRKLIERSMREIAAEFAIGRFYTRRV
jgi:flavin-binding protein dodecin